MPLRIVRWISLLCTAIALSALAAHVLELPNKFALDEALWVARAAKSLSRLGPFVGPIEVAAMVSTWVLFYLVRSSHPARGLTLFSSALLNAALVVFFALNAPANSAFASWTPTTLPSDWANYRPRWESGHALRFLFALPAFIALPRAFLRDAINRASQRNATQQGY